jgi:hypothetical protein
VNDQGQRLLYAGLESGLVRVPTRDGGQVTACLEHMQAAMIGALAHTMPEARRIAASWYEQHTAADSPASIFAVGVLYDPPRCCPAADWAQSNIMAAFRELTRGDGWERIGRDGDWLECACGNDPSMDGFWPCTPAGARHNDQLDGWDQVHYWCASCGRIINQHTLEVTGYA